MNKIAIDLESIPSQNLGKELLSIAERKCAKKRGDNKDVNKFCNLNPEFGQIVCIALWDGNEGLAFSEEPLVGFGEKEMLEGFWSEMSGRRNSKIVTFNGKAFDIPYILKRSALRGVPPTMRIPTRRHYTDQHFDILKVLSDFYQGEMLSLRDYCKIFGIQHCDDNSNCASSGEDIYPLWQRGKTEEIKKHCLGNAKAVMALYEKLKPYF